MGNNSGKTSKLEQMMKVHNMKGADRERFKNNIDTLLPTGDTLLFAAIQDRHIETVRFLLDAGASVNHCDKNGDSPLSTAIRSGSEEIVQTLLDHKNIKVNICDRYGLTPLHVACLRKKPNLAEMLLEEGAESWPLPLDSTKPQPSPPLMMCLEVSDLTTMKVLLDSGASPNAVDHKGDTALIKAIYNKQKDFAWLLLNYKPDLKIKNNHKNSALQYALQLNFCDIVKALVQKGLGANGHDPYDFRIKSRERALFMAIRNNCKKCFQVLIDAGEDIFLETGDVSPLLCALDHRKLPSTTDLHTINFEPPFIISSERLNVLVQEIATNGTDFEIVWNKAVWMSTTVDILAGRELAHIFCMRSYGFGGNLPVVQQRVAYFRALALNAADEAMSLLCYAYYTPSKEDVTVVETRRNRRRFAANTYNPPQAQSDDTEPLVKALENFRSNSRSLENLCVIAIRKLISHNVLYKAPKLGLPKRLIDLVTFENSPSFATEIKLVK